MHPYSIPCTQHASKSTVCKLLDGIKKLPGPGQYDPKPSINDTGSYFLSKFRSSLVRTFGKVERVSPENRKIFNNTPGPGTYRAPSDFGYYQARDLFVRETNRVETSRKAKTRRSSLADINDERQLSMHI